MRLDWRVIAVLLSVLLFMQAPAQASRRSGPASMEQTFRSALELYRLQHDGRWPDLQKYPDAEQLLAKTDVDGNIGAGHLGPYLHECRGIVNRLNDLDSLQIVAGPISPGAKVTGSKVGWVYSIAGGGRLLPTDRTGLTCVAVAELPIPSDVKWERFEEHWVGQEIAHICDMAGYRPASPFVATAILVALAAVAIGLILWAIVYGRRSWPRRCRV